MTKFGIRESFTCPTPRPRYDDGPKIWLNKENTMECSYDVPKKRVIMAQDQAPDDHMQDIAVELSQLLQGLSPDDRSRAEEDDPRLQRCAASRAGFRRATRRGMARGI
jgi:hypothetical protein